MTRAGSAMNELDERKQTIELIGLATVVVSFLTSVLGLMRASS
jgi:hypothetical protein